MRAVVMAGGEGTRLRPLTSNQPKPMVPIVGKLATWLLYASLGFVMVTHKGTQWPLWIFWAGMVLAVVSFVEYAVRAKREAFA